MSGLRPLVLHVVYRFDVGGLENGVVNLINHMPADAYRHAVLAVTQVVDSFARRIERDDVQLLSLNKPPGQGYKVYPQMWRVLRQLRPHVVHTRNLAALEMSVPAWAAGVPVRIHGEHGRDVEDLDGTVKRYQWIRRAYRPFVTRYVALSQDLQHYLSGPVGVASGQIAQIYNGVDVRRFRPRGSGHTIVGCPFVSGTHWLIGSVGRMQAVKDPMLLAEAFARLVTDHPALRPRVRLVMVGDGPLRAAVQQRLAETGLAELAWLPGERADVPDILRGLDCFVLPSKAEGVSNTILEAMATGLPVVVTRVGGNEELVRPDVTGALVPSGDAQAMAKQLARLALEPACANAWGAAARGEVERRFSLEAMVESYRALYDQCLRRDTLRSH